ncbi:hypothetical protein HDU83_008908 [Entophlyctis luteolus]|nr:hypothetical protein HDU83_008908 [Entophlyctis luteolus]
MKQTAEFTKDFFSAHKDLPGAVTPNLWLESLCSEYGPLFDGFLESEELLWGYFTNGFKIQYGSNFSPSDNSIKRHKLVMSASDDGAAPVFNIAINALATDSKSNTLENAGANTDPVLQKTDISVEVDNEPDFTEVESQVPSYRQMSNSKKLKLKSGRFVEDVMFKHGLMFQYIHPIHSFIYVHEDLNLKGIFTLEEEVELQHLNLKETPRPYTPKGTFSSFFKKFMTIDDLDKLRAVLFSGHPELTNEDDPEFWICQMFFVFLLDMLLLGKKKSQCFSLGLSEAWILANPWSMIQKLFHDTEHIYFLGGEKSGLAGQERKDVSRTLPGLESMSTRATGKKGDGYIRVFGSALRDVGAMEAGPKWEGPKGTKCFFESGLMPKTLRDILWSYSTKCGHRAEVLTKLVIPGVLVYGEGFKRVELDSIGGYVTRIRSSQWKMLNLSGGVKALTSLFLDIYRVRVSETAA